MREEDECYFLREYIPRGGFQAGETNQLIFNLKKTPERKGRPEWQHKLKAIARVGAELKAALNRQWLDGAVVVPIPPSKAKTDPAYDDRMTRVAEALCAGTGGQARELLVRSVSTAPHHLQETARNISAIAEAFAVDEDLTVPAPTRIALLDDLITTGAHFRAAKRVLLARFAGAHVIGVFVARRIIVDEEEVE